MGYLLSFIAIKASKQTNKNISVNLVYICNYATRLHNFKRNRPSFIHVTAEAMNRQKSQRFRSSSDSQSPWEFSKTRLGYLICNTNE